MIYMLSISELVPGKMAEWLEIAAKEMVPIYARLGIKSVASWHGYTGNMNEMYSLYVFDDLADLQKSEVQRRQDKDARRIAAKLNALRVSQTRTILEPNAWSPMK